MSIDYLTCGAQWCTPCPKQWQAGVKCEKSDEILEYGERWEREAQAALDAYDLVHPEDFLDGMIRTEKDN